MRPEPIHIIILVIVILLIFGAPKLPMIAKNIGKSMKVFKSEVKDLRSDDEDTNAQPRELGTDSGAAGSAQPGTGQAAANQTDEQPRHQ